MSISPTQSYRLINQKTRSTIIVKGDSSEENTDLLLGTSTHTDKWQIEALTNGYYRFVNTRSNLVLSIKDDKNDDNTPLVQHHWSVAHHQQWKLKKGNDEQYQIINRANKKLLMYHDGQFVIHKKEKGEHKWWKFEASQEHRQLGNWVISVGDDHYISQSKEKGLPNGSTTPSDKSLLQFIFIDQTEAGQQLAHLRFTDSLSFISYKDDEIKLDSSYPSPNDAWTIIDEEDYTFSLRKDSDHYLYFDEHANRFRFTHHGKRGIFNFTFLVTDSHVQPRPLLEGEIALYTEENLSGTAYVIHGELPDFRLFKSLGLDDSARSVQLATNTFTRLYSGRNYDDHYIESSEDISTLADTTVKRKTISSAQVFVASEMPYQGHWAIQRWGSASFEIVNKNSLYALHVDKGSKDSGANVNQDDWRDITSQEWLIKQVSEHYYQIINKNSQKVLELAAGSKGKHANVQQGTWKGSSRQQWKLKPELGGYYRITNKKTGLALTVAGGSFDKEANVEQDKWKGKEEQFWFLNPMSSYLSGSGHKDSMHCDANIHGETELRIIEHGAETTGVQRVQIYYPKHELYLTVINNRLKWNDTAADFLLHEEADRIFSLQHKDSSLWAIYNEKDDAFDLDADDAKRELFKLAVKVAKNHEETGYLENGEVAFFEEDDYTGKNWVFYQNYSNLHQVIDMKAKSMRLGEHTSVDVFQESFFHGSSTAITDDLKFSDDTIKFSKITSLLSFQIELASSAGVKILNALSQDYKNDDDGNFGGYSNYRTTLKFPQKVSSVLIRATEKATIDLGGFSHTIDPVVGKTAKIDTSGQLTINLHASDLTVPALLIHTNLMGSDEFFPVYPDQQSHEKMSGLDEHALWDAQNQDKHLVDHGKYDKDDIGKVQSAVVQLAGSIKYVPSASSAGKHSKQVIDTSDMLDKHWQLQFGQKVEYTALKLEEVNAINGKVKPEHLTKHSLSQSFWGDVWDGIKNDASKITHVVVSTSKKAAHAIENIASDVKKTLVATFHYVEDGIEKAFQFVVQAAKFIGEMLETILKKIEVALEDFIQWLRFLFEWDDILDTKDAIEFAFSTAIEEAQKQVTTVQKKADDFLDGLVKTVENDIDQLIQQIKEHDKTPKSSFESVLDEATEKVAWFFSLLNEHGSHLQVVHSHGHSSSDSSDVNSITDLLKKVIDTTDGGNEDVMSAFQNAYDTLKANNLSIDAIFIGVLEALKGVAAFMINTAKKLVDALASIISDLLSEIQKLLTTTWNIPIISDLYQQIAHEELSILSLMSLFWAIPATVLAKGVTGKAPFPKQRSLKPDKSYISNFNDFVSPVGYLIGGPVSSIKTLTDTVIKNGTPSTTAKMMAALSDASTWIQWAGGLAVKIWTVADKSGTVSTNSWAQSVGGLLPLAASKTVSDPDIVPVLQSMIGIARFDLGITVAIQNKDVLGGLEQAFNFLPSMTQFLTMPPLVSASDDLSMLIQAGIQLGGNEIAFGLAVAEDIEKYK